MILNDYINHDYTIIAQSPAMPRVMFRNFPALLFKSLEGVEQIGELFSYRITLQTPDASISSGLSQASSEHANVNYKQLIGQEFNVAIALDRSAVYDADKSIRYISGIVTKARYVQSDVRRSIYEVIIEPWLTLATRTSDYKIFQQKTVLDILREVLDDYNYAFEFRTMNTYPKPRIER